MEYNISFAFVTIILKCFASCLYLLTMKLINFASLTHSCVTLMKNKPPETFGVRGKPQRCDHSAVQQSRYR